MMFNSIPHGAQPTTSNLQAIHFIDVTASAGGNSVIEAVEDRRVKQCHSPRERLRNYGIRYIGSLKLFTVSGDSMATRLLHGNIVMIYTSQRTASPPGIFILHDALGLMVKQIEYLSHTEPVTIQFFSENTAFGGYDRSIEEVHIIGRVV